MESDVTADVKLSQGRFSDANPAAHAAPAWCARGPVFGSGE